MKTCLASFFRMGCPNEVLKKILVGSSWQLKIWLLVPNSITFTLLTGIWYEMIRKKYSSIFALLNFCKNRKTMLIKEIPSPSLIFQPKFMKIRPKIAWSISNLWYLWSFYQKNHFDFHNHVAKKRVFSWLIFYSFGKAKSASKMQSL